MNANLIFKRHDHRENGVRGAGVVAVGRMRRNGDGDDGDDDDAASEVVSVAGSPALTMTNKEEDRKSRDERDRERWAKLKRLKQAFHVKRRKGKGKLDAEGVNLKGKVPEGT